MGRRFLLTAVVVFAASLGGVVSGHAQPLRTATLQAVEPVTFNRQPVQRPKPQPGTLIASVRDGRTVAVRTGPDGTVVARVSSRTEFGSPRTFAATPAANGLRVVTTELPNGRMGWVADSGALRLSRSALTLDVDLSARVLRVRNSARVVRTIRVGVGAAGTSTPIGRFAITDKLAGADYSAVYGCCILALSGHQTNLPPGWTGGDRVAVHGGSTEGAVSTGCLHAAEADLRFLMRVIPLGAQVTIHP
jgi:hypothetical protein